MACTECRNFSGSPVCGACRAAKRVLNIIQSGRLPRSEERRVTGLVRGLVGELSDLLGAHLSVESKVPPSEREDKGETKAPTPGAFVAEKVKKSNQSQSIPTLRRRKKSKLEKTRRNPRRNLLLLHPQLRKGKQKLRSQKRRRSLLSQGRLPRLRRSTSGWAKDALGLIPISSETT